MALQSGNVVRLRLVATVTDIGPAGITVRSHGGTDVVFPRAIADDPGFAYEVQPASEPAYQAGQLYRDADGHVFQRTGLDQPGDRWRVLLHDTLPVGRYIGERAPARPLTQLVPAQPEE